MTMEVEPYRDEEVEELGDKFDALHPLFAALVTDVRTLSAKKPDGLLNARKIQTVNRILVDLLALMEREPSRPYLEIIQEDDVPQYSDVAMMLGQFDAALNSFKERYWSYSLGWRAEPVYSDDDEEDYEDEGEG